MNFKKLWLTIKATIFNTLKDPFSTLKYEFTDLYDNVYYLCNERCAKFPKEAIAEIENLEELVNRRAQKGHPEILLFCYLYFLRDVMNILLNKKILEIPEKINWNKFESIHPDNFLILENYCSVWKSFNISMNIVNAIFGYLNTNFLQKQESFVKIAVKIINDEDDKTYFFSRNVRKFLQQKKVDFDAFIDKDDNEIKEEQIEEKEYSFFFNTKELAFILWEHLVFKKMKSILWKLLNHQIDKLRKLNIQKILTNSTPKEIVSNKPNNINISRLPTIDIEISNSNKVIEILCRFIDSLNELNPNLFDLYLIESFFKETSNFYRLHIITKFWRTKIKVYQKEQGENEGLVKPEENNVFGIIRFINSIICNEKKRIDKFPISKKTKTIISHYLRNLIFVDLIPNKNREDQKKEKNSELEQIGSQDIFFVYFKKWFVHKEYEKLKSLFEISSYYSPLKTKFANHLELFIIDEGIKRFKKLYQVQAQSHSKKAQFTLDPETYILFFFQFHKEYQEVIKTNFGNDFVFLKRFKIACSKIINSKELKLSGLGSPAFHLAQYCHKTLRNGEEFVIEDRISKVISFFKFLDDGDMFLQFYGKFLAKRLLALSYSLDDEKLMLQNLKIECSYSLVYKFERMFKDIQSSKKINQQFITYLQQKRDQKIHEEDKKKQVNMQKNQKMMFEIQVLTKGSWPISNHSNSLKFCVPKEIEEMQIKFEKFYQSQFSGKKLFFLYDKSFGMVQTCINFKKPKQYMFVINTYQLKILEQFTDQNIKIKTLEEIIKSTRINRNDLEKNLKILLKYKILTYKKVKAKEKGKKIFRINLNFYSKKRKIRIHQHEISQLKEEEKENTKKGTKKLRKIQVSSVIVRLMKSQKIMDFNTLILEVVKQSNHQKLFYPSKYEVKKVIESLEEGEYLKRNSENPNMIEYIA